jgi:iron-sulfur cluster repair protein YtfE (RIC family)
LESTGAYGMSDIDTIVQDLKDAQWKSNDEIERLQRYEELVQFIANDYHELSHDKAMWQRDDWKKRCKKLIEEDHAQSSN